MVIGTSACVRVCVVLESYSFSVVGGNKNFLCFCSCVLLYNISRRNFNRLLLGLLRQQDRVDVRQDTARRDRDRTQQLGQFFIVSDGQLDVSLGYHFTKDIVARLSVKNVQNEAERYYQEIEERFLGYKLNDTMVNFSIQAVL